jgi:hypothetical protein
MSASGAPKPILLSYAESVTKTTLSTGRETRASCLRQIQALSLLLRPLLLYLRD